MTDQPRTDVGPGLLRFYETIGVPVPEPLTPDEKADFDRRQDEVDAAIAKRSRTRRQAA